jgi:hypothetical protein
MYAIVSACRYLIGVGAYETDPLDLVQSVLAKWLGFEEYAIKQPHNSNYFSVYNDPETGAEKTDWNFNNYYKGRTLVSDLKAHFDHDKGAQTNANF